MHGYHPSMASFDQVTLRTKRLVLRPFTEGDADALFNIYSDPEVCRYLPFPAWADIEFARKRIAKDRAGMGNGEYVRFALERIEDGAIIGDCCLFNLNAQCRRAEIGYSQRRSAWGNGYIDEGLRALIEFGFTEIDLNRIEADIDPRNLGSAKSLERLGFVKEGHLRERWIVEGEVSDTGLYGLLAGDWQSAKAGA
jgi:[ribosomal protein S5]-alanine N-acetyltransferase